MSNLHISLHEKITGTDGTYDFDATVRYQFAELSFLVLVEAKLHKNPIKRELVQVLYQKVQSAGAHKGVIVSTAPHQTGAVRFAQVHGIALATVTEGRFLYEARDALPAPQLSRAEAAARLGYPTFISNYYESGDKMGSIRVWSLLPGGDEYTRDVADLLLGAENLPRKITAQGSAVASNRRAPGRGLFVPKPTPFVVYLANVLLGLQLGVWLRPRKSGIGTARCYSVGYSSAWRARY